MSTGGTTPDDDDLGEPIDGLKDLSLPLDPQFSRRVRGSIERRLLAGELLSLAWAAPLAVLMELLRAPFEQFAGRKRE
jgi:hypothetical protein